MIHPPHIHEIERLHPKTIFTDVYMDYPIGDVVKQWTQILLNCGIKLKKSRVDDKGINSDGFYRPHHKTFPWMVDIIHMYSSGIALINKVDCYKINFNLEDSETIDKSFEDRTVYIGTLGYILSKDEKEYVTNLFKGDWVDYLDIQSSRIIVQFWLEDYYPIFRKEKILHIKKKLLSL